MTSTSPQPLLFHQRLNPSARGSANASIRFQGELSTTALSRAMAFIVRRHEALRMRYIRCNQQVRQSFAEPTDWYDLPVTHAADLAAAEERIKSCANASTDLEVDGPLRAELIQIDPSDHILLLIIHTHVIDDFSSRLLTRELLIAYDSYFHDQDPSLPPAMRYSDYVLEEFQHQEDMSEAQLEYWRSVVSGSVDPIPKRENGSAQPFVKFRFMASSITSIETDHLRQFSAAANVSMTIALYAIIFLAVSGQYSTNDVIATVAYSGRDSRTLKTLVAKTTRQFPLRMVMNSSVPLSQFARKTQATFMQGAVASRMPVFTSLHTASQTLRELRSAADGTQREEGTHPQNQLFIADHSDVQRKLDLATPNVSASRIILDPRAYDSPAIDLDAIRTSPLGDGPLLISLRRDLSVEAGRPVTFLGGFYSHAIGEREVALLLARMCDIARMTCVDNRDMPIGELISRTTT